ncbi:ribosome-inactivating family protein [Streptomyces sp. NPDC059070]|uniref:ribosome-inactivating family protein n=1 Tax=Streptomyces sp. NPDC059070 TaxID=3346713 RepID=UPI003688F62C
MRKEIPALLLTAALLTGVAPAAQAADGRAPAATTAAAVGSQAIDAPYTWDLTQTDDAAVRTTYGRVIAGLRTAVGHHLEADPTLLETSTSPDIVSLRVQLPGNRYVFLHYTADNLYLRGFSVAGGDVVQFNDFDLGRQMGRSSRVLPFNGRYGQERGHLEANSSVDRAHITFERSTLFSQLNDLYDFANRSGSVNNQRVATAALTMVTATSEAARFRPVYESILNAMPDGGDRGSQSADNIELENDWSALTGFTRQILRGEQPAPRRVGTRTFRNIRDIRNVLVMVLSTKH